MLKEKSLETEIDTNCVKKIRFFPKTKHYTAYIPLLFCLLLALGLRLWLMLHTNNVIEGDEAIVGLQAKHILEGERPFPVYYYGQPYMGSLEAYLIAILFKIGGISVFTLRLEPTLLSLALVWLTWKFARELADSARLSPQARYVFTSISTLIAACPPLYDAITQLRVLGGYIETFVLMLVLLLWSLQLTRRWEAGASRRELALRWAGVGFVCGLGMWVDPLIVSAIVAAGLWIGGYCLLRIIRFYQRREQETQRRSGRTLVSELLLATAILPAAVVGLLPAIYWGRIHHWANVKYIFQLQQTQATDPTLQAAYPDRSAVLRGMVHLYLRYVAPRIIGGSQPVEDYLSTIFHICTLATGLLCILCSILLLLVSLKPVRQSSFHLYQLVALPLLFAFCTAIIFCLSSGSTIGLSAFPLDAAGRYASPLMLVLPFFFAVPLTWFSLFQQKRKTNSPTPITRNGTQTMGIHTERQRLNILTVISVVLSGLLFLSMGMQIATYTDINPGTTFQSPECPIASASNEALIAYLQQEHVHYGWAMSWIGNPIIFKTQEKMIFAEPRGIINGTSTGRIPAYTFAVAAAPRPAFVVFIRHNDQHPILLQILQQLHVSYHAHSFPAQPGIDILAVTSLSKKVSLFDSKDMIQAFKNCNSL